MNTKAWTVGEIRNLARQTVEGKEKVLAARGEYFRALVGTAQTDLGGKADQDAQRAAVKAVHRKFYEAVWDAIATDEILLAAEIPRKRLGVERNRRLNFARSSHGTIQRWLRAEGHDLMKLDAKNVSKSQLDKEAPPTRKHALTTKRIKARAGKLLDNLLGFARMVAKADQAQAVVLVQQAIEQLAKLQAATTASKLTTDVKVAANESRPLRLGGTVFWPTDIRAKRAA